MLAAEDEAVAGRPSAGDTPRVPSILDPLSPSTPTAAAGNTSRIHPPNFHQSRSSLRNLETKDRRRIPVEERQDAAGRLLNRAPTREDSPPQTRRRCRSRAPPRGGRVREDLFQRNAAASTSPASPGNPNLDTLGPNLQTALTAGERAAVSTTSQRARGHRRQRRPPSPPTATRSHIFPVGGECLRDGRTLQQQGTSTQFK